MQIRLGFTIMPGEQGWQFPPIQFVRSIEVDTSANLELLKSDLMKVMDFADKTLAPYRKPNTEDNLNLALKALAAQGQLSAPKKKRGK